jgi:hypothetical protein
MNFKAEEDEALDAPVPTQPSLPAQDYRNGVAVSPKAGKVAPNNLAVSSPRSRPKPSRGENGPAWRNSPSSAVDRRQAVPSRRRSLCARVGRPGLELEQRVSREDLASLKQATQYPPSRQGRNPRYLAGAVCRMGFDGGRVLEPGYGTSLFFRCRRVPSVQARVDRRRNGPNNRPDRQTPLPERPH